MSEIFDGEDKISKIVWWSSYDTCTMWNSTFLSNQNYIVKMNPTKQFFTAIGLACNIFRGPNKKQIHLS